MTRILSGISLFLASCFAYASEGAATPPPAPEPTSPMSLIAFAIIFLGMIGGFFYYMWKNERKRKEQDGAPE
jgi:heme/copper-type cytochrome/quinol oxidase subunit 2